MQFDKYNGIIKHWYFPITFSHKVKTNFKLIQNQNQNLWSFKTCFNFNTFCSKHQLTSGKWTGFEQTRIKPWCTEKEKELTHFGKRLSGIYYADPKHSLLFSYFRQTNYNHIEFNTHSRATCSHSMMWTSNQTLTHWTDETPEHGTLGCHGNKHLEDGTATCGLHPGAVLREAVDLNHHEALQHRRVHLWDLLTHTWF